jgi:general secretion pathway protein D
MYGSSGQKNELKAEDKGKLDQSTAEQTGKPVDASKSKQASVRIIAIPNTIKRETVKAEAEREYKQKSEQTPEEVLQKPIELSVQAAAGEVQVIVENMPLYDFINLVFGDILKLNYTISPELQNAQEKITLNMNRKMTGKDFFPFAVDLLRKNNLDIRDENGVVYLRRKTPLTAQYTGAASSEFYVGSIPQGISPQKTVSLLLTSSYVPVNQILQMVRQLQMINNDIKAEPLSGTSALVLSGTVGSLNRIVGIFEQLDRSSFANRDFSLVYFDYMNVNEFDRKIREVMPAIGIPMGKTPSDVGVLTITFEKINALLIISEHKEWLDAILMWKNRLDTVESMGDEVQLFVYHPQNRPAEDLVEILKTVASGGATAVPTSSAPGAQRPAPTAAGASIVPGKGFSVALDRGRNAIIVSSTPSNYKLIRSVLIQLDTSPRQVLIEATIMEVTLNDQLQFGMEWYLKHSMDSGKYEGNLSTLGGLALGGTGLNYVFNRLPGDFQAKINMFAKKNLINIVSTPHIAMLDGKDATINVGTEVPVVTSEISATDISSSSTTSGTTKPSIMRNVQYRSTGVILRVKPVINSEGTLTIDINQELSEAQNNTVSTIDSPLILKRSIQTTLAVKSGETVLLGGLISTNKSTGESKVPFFGDIPYLGSLFKTESTGTAKTELIVQITPYILNDLDQLEYITRQFKDTLFLK